MDLTQDADSRAVLRLLSTPVAIGRPIFTGPGVPPERVNALRAAFDATMKDPALRADAAKEHLDLNPVSGGELQEIVSSILAPPPRVVARLASIIGAIGGEP
jgi:tripartite-type tricarboxylate transporter receptor subunit TctC